MKKEFVQAAVVYDRLPAEQRIEIDKTLTIEQRLSLNAGRAESEKYDEDTLEEWVRELVDLDKEPDLDGVPINVDDEPKGGDDEIVDPGGEGETPIPVTFMEGSDEKPPDIHDIIEGILQQQVECRDHDPDVESTDFIPFRTTDMVTDWSVNPKTREADVFEKIVIGDLEKSRFTALVAGMGPVVNATMGALMAKIQGQQRKHIVNNKRHGKSISVGGVIRYVTSGNDAIFRQRTNKNNPRGAAVHLTIDASGSMGGNRWRLACQSVFVFGEILEKLGTPFMVSMWSTHNDDTFPLDNNFDRNAKNFIYTVKDFSDSWSQRKYALGFIPHMSCNTDGDSILWAASKLNEYASKTHKVPYLWVFSDGMPSMTGIDPGSFMGREIGGTTVRYRDAGWLKTVIYGIQKSGIRLAGFGIEYAGVSDYYKNAVIVTKAEDLPMKIMTELQNEFMEVAV
jgi:cobalamin biosynthesis protein CobT